MFVVNCVIESERVARKSGRNPGKLLFLLATRKPPGGATVRPFVAWHPARFAAMADIRSPSPSREPNADTALQPDADSARGVNPVAGMDASAPPPAAGAILDAYGLPPVGGSAPHDSKLQPLPRPAQTWAALRREMAAEAVGTFFIVIFGVGSVCSAVSTGSLVGLWQVHSSARAHVCYCVDKGFPDPHIGVPGRYCVGVCGGDWDLRHR